MTVINYYNMKILIKKLSYIKHSIYCYNWDVYREIMNLLFSGKIKFKSLSGGRYKYITESKEEIFKWIKETGWHTYDRGFDLILDEHTLKVVCWNCDNFYGDRLDVKWEGIIILPKKYLPLFSDCIDNAFDRYLNNLYKQELEYAKDKRIQELKLSLL